MNYWMLFAGLGLFLFGMKQLEDALKLLAGKRFKKFISQSTNHPTRSVFSGMVATVIVQSSSMVGLVVLAFVGAGIIPLANAIGVVLGSNLGTTITGWIVATVGFKLNFSQIVFPFIALGGIGYVLLKGSIKSLSLFILGFGILIMGLGLMKDSANQFTQEISFELLKDYPLIIYLIFGMIVTAIIQSSSAVMMLALTALYSGVVTLPAAAAVVIGADLGTSSTVLIGSIQGPIAKRQLAIAQVIFNLVVDVMAFLFLYQLLSLIGFFQLTDPLLSLVAFHSLFNLLGLLVFLPFVDKYSQFIKRLVKSDPQDQLPQYINNVPANITDAAIQALSLETKRLISLVLMLNYRMMHLTNKTLSQIDLPQVFQDKSNIEFYVAIKKQEGNIINYALKVQLGNNQSEMSVENQESIAHQIDQHMKAIRAAIYSAKALKDIHDDLDAFEETSDLHLKNYYKKILYSATEIYDAIVGMMNLDNKLNDEALQALKIKATDFYNGFRQLIHKKMSSQPIQSYDLSTLLNVNMEIYTSESALIEALMELPDSIV